MDTLKALMVFMATAEHGSFSEAARRLGVSPAAVSQSIARLEQELEVRLFNRTTRQLMLTEDGRRFYSQCRGPVVQLDSAITQVKESRDEPVGQLRVSLPPSFATRFVLPLLGEFHQRFPKVRVFLGMNDQFTDLVEAGFDIGIRVGMLPDSRLVARQLAEIPMMTVAAPGYWAKHAKPQQPEDLRAHDCINYQFSTTGRLCKWEFEQGGERMPLEVSGTYTVNDIGAVVELARHGLGVAQLPAHEVLPYLRSGELVSVLEGFVSCHRGVHVCFPHREHIAPRTTVFVDFLLERLSGHPDLPSCAEMGLSAVPAQK